MAIAMAPAVTRTMETRLTVPNAASEAGSRKMPVPTTFPMTSATAAPRPRPPAAEDCVRRAAVVTPFEGGRRSRMRAPARVPRKGRRRARTALGDVPYAEDADTGPGGEIT
ncbi:hypothetical protein GCM10010176_032810 [Nonomuraea spiralis]|nr:hypothetical protein GCM10010176_032810 [Nonomuraea spiralis]